MGKPKLDKIREDRIELEIVVDCYNETERFGGWFCYLEDNLDFPFRARCLMQRELSPLKRGDEIEAVRLLDEGSDIPSEIFVQIKWQERKLGVPLAQLDGIGISSQAAEAIADWRYWCARGYSF